MGQDQLRVGELAAERDGVLPERRDPAAGVDQHRHAPLVRERDEAAHGGLVEAELLGARVQLDPARAGVQRARGLATAPSRGSTRQYGTTVPPDASAAPITKSLASR